MADSESRVGSLDTKFDIFISEIRDFKNEMRQQNQRRTAEIARADAKVEKLREQHEKDMKAIAKQRERDNEKNNDDIKNLNKKIDDKFDKLSSQIQNMARCYRLGGCFSRKVIFPIKK